MPRLLMMSSAACIAGIGIGIAFTFGPQEPLAAAGLRIEGVALLLYQIIGALCFGFSMINWMGKFNLIGSVFGRVPLLPIAAA